MLNFEAWAKPAQPALIIGLLGELRLLTIKPASLSADDLTVQLQLYARKLLEFPASEVVKVLKKQPTLNKFWPAWQELESEINYCCQKNKTMWGALKNYQDPPEKPKKVGGWYKKLSTTEKFNHKTFINGIRQKMDENKKEF